MADEGSSLPALSVSASRRAVVRTAAWSVPAVSLAAAAPAFASSADLLMYADATVYQTPTAWERVVWPEATDDSGSTRFENLLVGLAEDEAWGDAPVAFHLQIDLPESWPAGAAVTVEPSGLDPEQIWEPLEFVHLSGGSLGTGTITGRRIVATGTLRPGQFSSASVVVHAQGPLEDVVLLLSWGGKTEPFAVPMYSWSQAELGRDAPPLLVEQDPAARSFVLLPSMTDALLRLPAVSFPPEAPGAGQSHEVAVQLDIEYLAPFAGPLQGTLTLAGGSVGVQFVVPSSAGPDFSTNGSTIRWEGLVPLVVDDSIGAVELALRGAFEVNGIQLTARFLADDEEFEQFELVLVD